MGHSSSIMMFVQSIICLVAVAPCVRSTVGHSSYLYLHDAPTLQVMVYDEDMKCARIVRRRLGGRRKSTQKSEPHKTKEACDAAGNCEWSGCMYGEFGCSFSNSDSLDLMDHEFECPQKALHDLKIQSKPQLHTRASWKGIPPKQIHK